MEDLHDARPAFARPGRPVRHPLCPLGGPFW